MQSRDDNNFNTSDAIIAGPALYAIGEYHEAINVYTDALNQSSTSRMVNEYHLRLSRGRAYLALNEIDKAYEDFLFCIFVLPFERDLVVEGSAFFYKGLCLQLKGDKYEAIEDYTKAVSLRKISLAEGFFTYFNRGILHINNRNYQSAVNDFTHALASHYLADSFYVAAAEILKNACILNLLCDAEAMKYFEKNFMRDYQIISKYSKDKQICQFSISLQDIAKEIEQQKYFISERIFAQGESHLVQGNYAAAAKEFELNHALGLINSDAYGFYARGLEAISYGNTEEAKSQFDKAVSAYVVSPDHSADFSLWKSQLLHSLIHLRKLGVNVSLKGPIDAVNQFNPKTLTNVCLLIIAVTIPKQSPEGTPNKINEAILASSLKNLFQFQICHIPHFIKEDFITCLIQADKPFPNKFSASEFKNIAETKKQLFDLIIGIKNPFLRQTALVQALLPKTILGEIYNVAQGKFTPNLFSSTNKQKIAAVLLEDLRKRGPLMDEPTKLLFDSNAALKNEISSNCPELYQELVAAKIFTSRPGLEKTEDKHDGNKFNFEMQPFKRK